MRKFKVSAASDGRRADVGVAEKYPGFARSALARLFDDELVKVNQKLAKAGQKLHKGDQVEVDDKLIYAAAPAVDLPVVYEDDQVVVIDKPAGVLTHAKGAINEEGTVASFLQGKITDKNLTGNRAGIVHRLDRDTSGIIIAAKTSEALRHLQKQFSNRKTKKTYLAVVEGWPQPAEAIIDAPIQRNLKNPQTFKVGVLGRPAQTHYRTLKEFTKKNHKYALLELKPTTGRTHQLRVHLKYIDHPIVGDRVYGHEGQGLLLHAAALEITLPGSRRRTFESPMPERLESFIKQ